MDFFNFRRLPAILSSLTALFLFLSIVSAIASLSALRQLSDINYDSSGLAAVQLRMHFNLLMSELKHADDNIETTDLDNARLQYDITFQRLRSLPMRPPYDRILSDVERRQLEEVFAKFSAEALAMDASLTQGVTALGGVSQRLELLRPDIERMSGRVIQRSGEFRELRRNDIVRSVMLLIWSTASLVLTGAIFAYLLWRNRQSLRRQNEALEIVTQELREVSTAKSEFMALMSHEFRTPLNAIIGFSETLHRQDFGKIDNPKYVEYAQDIKKSGDHLLTLVNDILDLSKIEAGELTLNRTKFLMQEAVEEAVRLVPLQSGASDTRISIIACEGMGTVFADRRSFQQILINLLSNADKYTSSDGAINVSARMTVDGGAEVIVADSGVGIPADDLERVLEPFGQARQDALLTHEGTGLGLALCKQLMDMHKGQMSIESKVGEGTTVRFWFPPQAAA